MTAHERCVAKLQQMLRESARQLEKLADELPREITSYPLTEYAIDIMLMKEGQTYPFPLIEITCSSMAPRNDAKEAGDDGALE